MEEIYHLWAYLYIHPLFAAGIILVVGYYLGRLAGLIKLPEITGYIFAGLILGKSFFHIVPYEVEQQLGIFTHIALGLIALTIGGEFSLGKLKRLGKNVAVITLLQILATFLLVSTILTLLKMPFPIALMAGAIASATAPAATVHIVQTLKAHGTFVDMLYGVVALDDAGCVILFSIIFSMAGTMLGISGGDHGIASAIGHLLLEIGIGALGGFLIHVTTLRRKSENENLIVMLGLFFSYTVLVMGLGMSPLLTNMAAGTVLINLSPRNHRLFRVLRPLTPPLYAMFFVLAGMELDPRQFLNPVILLMGSGFIIARALGKYGGVFGGCSLVKTDHRIRNYLGFCMLPQAGVAIGLSDIVTSMHLPIGTSPEIVAGLTALNSVVLMSVFINEILGPPLSKFALIKGNRMEE
jgi:Kef-type K+ transport system membrane component KefB